MANWKQIKEEMAVDQLFGLYIKVLKKTPVYAYIDGYGKGVLWQGWDIQPGTVAGELYSWVDGSEFAQYGIEDKIDGIYLMMNATQYTGGKYYYIKLEPNQIDWYYTRQQLDARRKANMNFYERWFDDLETKIFDLFNKYKDAVDEQVDNTKKLLTKVLIGGVIVGGVWLWWNSYYKYELLLKKGAKLLK